MLLREPQPPPHRRNMYTALTAVVFTTAFQRFGYYSIIGNLFMFLVSSPLSWSIANATRVQVLSSALCYLSAIFFGILSDVWIAKYYVIVYAMFIFATTTVLYPILYPHNWQYYILPTHSCVDNLQNSSYYQFFTKFSKQICQLGNNTSGSLFNENCAIPIIIDIFLMMLSAGAIEAALIPFGSELVTDSCF